MKNILLLVHDDAGQEARLQVALDLARSLDGHLTCLDVVQLPVPVGDYVNDAGQYAVLEFERTQEASNIARLEQRLRSEDVRWEIKQTTGDIGDCIARDAGLADVLVVNRKIDDPSGPQMLAIAGHVVRQSGKPIVAVPQTSRGIDVQRLALIAWDGSMPAKAALTAAVPLLQRASSVLLFEVGEEAGGSSAEEAASYLSRHGVHPTIQRVEGGGRDVAELIQHAAIANEAAYCVMGAYGHSPLREAVFGGVTRKMLRTSEIPLFLAH